MDTNLKTVSTPSTAEEENKLVNLGDGSNCSYLAGQTRLTTNIESLPDDILFDILLRLPAQDNHARLVCPKWQQMIRTHGFVRAHDLQHSTPRLLIQTRCDRPIFVATRKGRIEISNFDNKFASEVLSSCNGLILEKHGDDDLYITNHATRQHFALPPFLTKTTTSGAAISYVAAAMEYKVVHVSSDSLVCGILTVGVDKDWSRCVNTQHLSPEAKWLLTQRPLVTQGFVHWAPPNACYFEYVLSLNVETEIITKSRGPSCFCGHGGETKLRYHYLPMGSYLSLLVAHVGFSWDEVWEMKPETGEWAMVASINLEAQKFRCEGVGVSALNCILRPIGWLRLREVLVFRVCKSPPDNELKMSRTRSCIAYNVHTHEVDDSFELENNRSDCHSFHTNNSLAWITKFP